MTTVGSACPGQREHLAGYVDGDVTGEGFGLGNRYRAVRGSVGITDFKTDVFEFYCSPA